MNRLLSADFAKLMKYRFYHACLTGMFLFGAFMSAMNCFMATYNDRTPYFCNMLFVYALLAALLIPAFSSLFTGTEFSDGTIRNKLILGHRRRDIYLSNVIVCFTAGVTMCLTYIAGATLAMLPWLNVTEIGSISAIIILILVSFLMCAAFAALCTLTVMTSQNKAASAVINILLSVALLIVSLYILSQLSQPPTWQPANYNTETGEVTFGEPEPNPFYVGGTTREVLQFFNDFLPTGQSVNITQGGASAGDPGLLAAYSASIVIVSTGIGIFAFKKKDIK